MATFFYYGLCVGELVKEDKEYMEEQKKQHKEEKKKEEEEAPDFDYNFGRAEEDMEEEMIKQAIALSLADSKPKEEEPQDLLEEEEEKRE